VPVQDPELPCAECWDRSHVEVPVPLDRRVMAVARALEREFVSYRTVTWRKMLLRCCARHPDLFVWEFLG